MELKDVILSTLAEIEQLSTVHETTEPEKVIHSVPPKEISPFKEIKNEIVSEKSDRNEEEIRILDGIRERLLVLFEGFQSPNNVQIEAKVDLTLNFLEYLLATIDSRLETIKEKA
ncbi:MAG: hypothetical protein PHW18_05695 [Sulfuricurvum sp.]|uniref:CiaD-like domain-containing protein n=1 Tax=Sulfuricurvum sp. TaxID=2025608 RepID=UPI002630759C|nr:hypothetical protein [Sulfuricurvum sp.]MDD2829050.1 hypothetical protein [Sulfuricurvum sp.]MDD4949697.1 hypothetical protein [Sulfuricurvum sp.]